jgi:hypothetical protein
MIDDHLVKTVVAKIRVDVGLEEISLLLLLHFMGGFSCILFEILMRVQVCDCGAYNGPFQEHYFNHHCEDALMMEPRSAETCSRSYFHTCTVHLLLLFITTNKCTINITNTCTIYAKS